MIRLTFAGSLQTQAATITITSETGDLTAMENLRDELIGRPTIRLESSVMQGSPIPPDPPPPPAGDDDE